MISQDLFVNEWTVWFCFVADPKESKDNYQDNYKRVFDIKSPLDLAYLWNNHKLSNLDNFFVNAESRQFNYLVEQKWKVVNSIEYFKKDIQPKWEDVKNENGGRFVFPVGKAQENKDELYTNIVFYLMGEDFNHSQHINGFRLISPKNNQSVYRVEIWVDFDSNNMQVLQHFQDLLTNLFKSLNFDSKSVRFMNNRTDSAISKQGKDGKAIKQIIK